MFNELHRFYKLKKNENMYADILHLILPNINAHRKKKFFFLSLKSYALNL